MINIIHHWKCMRTVFTLSLVCIRNLTRSLRSLVRFRYLTNSCVNTIRTHFPWSILYLLNQNHAPSIWEHLKNVESSRLCLVSSYVAIQGFISYGVFTLYHFDFHCGTKLYQPPLAALYKFKWRRWKNYTSLRVIQVASSPPLLFRIEILIRVHKLIHIYNVKAVLTFNF